MWRVRKDGKINNRVYIGNINSSWNRIRDIRTLLFGLEPSPMVIGGGFTAVLQQSTGKGLLKNS